MKVLANKKETVLKFLQEIVAHNQVANFAQRLEERTPIEAITERIELLEQR